MDQRRNDAESLRCAADWEMGGARDRGVVQNGPRPLRQTLADFPMMAKRIDDSTNAPAVLVRDGRDDGGSRGDCP